MSSRSIPRGGTIGCLGGGQLGWMIGEAAESLGYKTVFLESQVDCPASQVGGVIVGKSYEDEIALTKIRVRADVVTAEFENVPAQSLRFFTKDQFPVYPHPRVFEVCQSRTREKEIFATCGVPTVPWQQVWDEGQVKRRVYQDGDCILKTDRNGYDGKGQWSVTINNDSTNWRQAYEEARTSLKGMNSLILEKRVKPKKELSVILHSNEVGDTAVHEVAENVHINGILHTSVMPARIPPEIKNQAIEYTRCLAEKLKVVGTLAVEFFLTADDELLANEMAPRVHNSGHETWGGAETSQFENHIRAICGLPLGPTVLKAPAVGIVNLLGDLWSNGEPDWSLLKGRDVKLILYGKKEARKGRKMGHLFAVGLSRKDVLQKLTEAHQSLSKQLVAV